MQDHFRRGQITLSVEDGWACVRCAGEIDLAVRDRLRAQVGEALELSQTCWIDLTEVSFIDVSGIHALFDALESARARGACVLIAPARERSVMRPFELLELIDQLPLAYRTGERLRELPEPKESVHRSAPEPRPELAVAAGRGSEDYVSADSALAVALAAQPSPPPHRRSTGNERRGF